VRFTEVESEQLMAEKLKLNNPWLIAVWPGMGNVALNAGYYLLSKLGMSFIAEYEAGDVFDIEQVEVKEGIVQPVRRPRSRFFLWKDPVHSHDLVVFLGEAQPPIGKYPLCRKIIAYAQELGVQRIYTFAAMATQMHPQSRSRIFAAATDARSLAELKRLELEILEDGHIGGLNGVLVGAAAESRLHGVCLLGEMPHLFHQLPFPKASLAILEVFSTLAGIEIDLSELAEQASAIGEQLGEILSRVERAMEEQEAGEEEAIPEAAEEEPLSSADRQRIERLFAQAEKNRAKAFELKQELDRLDVFKEFEDRFLDLFKRAE
jgi:proteasome assembly chaperone (PAC2) family protein